MIATVIKKSHKNSTEAETYKISRFEISNHGDCYINLFYKGVLAPVVRYDIKDLREVGIIREE